MGGVARVRRRVPPWLRRDTTGGRSNGNSSSARIRMAGGQWAMAVSALLFAGLLLAGHFLNSAFAAKDHLIRQC